MVLVLVATLAVVLWPGRVSWLIDEPRLIAAAWHFNDQGQLADGGLYGNFALRYGPLPTQIYQALLLVTHEPVVLIIVRGLLCASVTAAALVWLGRTLALPLWFAACDPDLAACALPIIGCCGMPRSPSHWHPCFCCVRGFSANGAPRIAANLSRLHSDPADDPSAGATACAANPRMAALAAPQRNLGGSLGAARNCRSAPGAPRPLYPSGLLAGNRPSLRGGAEILSRSWIGSGERGWLRSSAGVSLVAQSTAGWKTSTKKAPVTAVITAAAWCARAIYPLIWLGIGAALISSATAVRQLLHGAHTRELPLESRVTLVVVLGLCGQALLSAAMRVPALPQYFMGTFVLHVVPAWFAVATFHRWRAGALLGAVYGIGAAVLTGSALQNQHPRMPTLANSVAIARELNGYSDRHGHDRYRGLSRSPADLAHLATADSTST
jgi:hypothetical protein